MELRVPIYLVVVSEALGLARHGRRSGSNLYQSIPSHWPNRAACDELRRGELLLDIFFAAADISSPAGDPADHWSFVPVDVGDGWSAP